MIIISGFIFIGVGIVLITVSGIAWRLTASDAPSCRAMLGLGGYEEDYNNGRFLSRPQVTNNTTFGSATRPQHPYAGNVATHKSQLNYLIGCRFQKRFSKLKKKFRPKKNREVKFLNQSSHFNTENEKNI